MIKETVSTGTKLNDQNNEIISEKLFSPIIMRSNTISNTDYKRNLNVSNLNLSQNSHNYSPFVIKKSPNLLNSVNSGSSSKSSCMNENLNNIINLSGSNSKIPKMYTPSPNNTFKSRLSDRFIPMNKGINLLEKFEMTRKWNKEAPGESNPSETPETGSQFNQLNSTNTYSHLLESNFFQQEKDSDITTPLKSKIFSYKSEKKRKSKVQNSGLTIDSHSILQGNPLNTDDVSVGSSSRKINHRPYKIIDAPGLIDDFYLNLVDWSSSNDLVVGQNNTVYLWCANKTQCVKLFNYHDDKYVSSVIWNSTGTEIAVGNSEGIVEIWDVNQRKLTRILQGHSGRVGVVAWNNNILSSGSKDYSILNRDLKSPSNFFSKLNSHKQEVCGLKWSFDGMQLASGGNDNKLMVWNMHSTNPLMKSSHHTAAVKAIAWSPYQNNLLASGGGTADRCIRFWNTATCTQSNFVDTGSQVCNLVFSKTVNELISTHGYSLNQIILWKLPSMTKLATLTGHTYRVLYLGMSPDGQNIVTGAGDETLRFWNIFPPIKSNEGSCLFPSNTDLR